MVRTFGAAFVFAGAFYLLLIDNTTSPELYAGAAAAVLAAGATTAARRNGLRGAPVRLGWLARGWRAVAQVPSDVFWVSVAAVEQVVAPRPNRGTWRAVPFAYGAVDNAADAGRRALAEALGSLPPNTIVLGADEEHDLLLAHQLRRSGGPDRINVLGH